MVALYLKLATTILAGTTTVLLGLHVDRYQELFGNIALCVSAVITIVMAYQLFFEPRKLWVREIDVLSKLKDIQRDLGYDLLASGGIAAERLEKYRASIRETLRHSLDWKRDKSGS